MMAGWPEDDGSMIRSCATGLLVEDGGRRPRFPYPANRNVIALDVGSARRGVLLRRISPVRNAPEQSTAG